MEARTYVEADASGFVGPGSDRIHAPNEKVEMGLLLKGAGASAANRREELAAAAAGASAGASGEPRP